MALSQNIGFAMLNKLHRTTGQQYGSTGWCNTWRTSYQNVPNTLLLMLSDNDVRAISFDGQYINGYAEKVLTNPNTNKYIIKGSTGIGGTTAILNNNNSNFIIVSPNVGMIRSKEKNRSSYNSDRQFFIYQGSKDQWQDVVNYLDSTDTPNAIINTTPDQIVNSIDNQSKWMPEVPLFIDEAHLYVQDADFRDSVGQFMELVYNQWKASFTLSTATPFYKFWDIPKDITMDFYKVSRREQTIKRLDISYDKKDIKRFVYEQHDLGRLVVIFTNNKNLHTNFHDLRVSNLVGDTLRIKLAPYNRGVSLNDLDITQTDVLILSSSYYAGYDIDHDCSVLIVSDQTNEAWKVNVNNIIQAYGRCRKTVQQALLVNLTSNYGDTAPKSKSELEDYYKNYINKLDTFRTILSDNQLRFEDEFSKYFVKYKYVNRAMLMSELIKKVDDYHLYNPDRLIEVLTEHNFEVKEYQSEDEKIYHRLGMGFTERMKNLVSIDDNILLRDYWNIKNNLKSKNDGTFSPKLALEYLTAHLLNISDATQIKNKLNNKRLYAGEFYRYVSAFLAVNGSSTNLLVRPKKEFIDNHSHHASELAKAVLHNNIHLTDDWHMLYRINQINNNKYPDKITRNLCIEQAINNEDIYLKYLHTGSNRSSNTRKAILNLLKSNGITLNQVESDRLKRKITENFNTLRNDKSFGQYYNLKYLKNQMKQAIIFGLTNRGDGVQKRVGHRQYNPFTALPRSLRSIIPIRFVEIDLTSANAQFVDMILDTDISGQVYQNIMDHHGITRSQAKWKYNTMLNNHKVPKSKATEFYLSAGYPEAKAKTLADMTANTKKGDFFKLMTKYEEAAINLYNEMLDYTGLRFHDALVVKQSDILSGGYVLPTTIITQSEDSDDFLCDLELPKNKEIYFHIGYYNNTNLNYDGAVSSQPHNAGEQLESDNGCLLLAS